MSYSNCVDPLIEELAAEAKPCEWTKGCDREATVMVWCDHHRLGCDYTGLRCDIHFNLLHQETVRQISIAKWRDSTPVCDSCGAVVVIGDLSDHFRWARL